MEAISNYKENWIDVSILLIEINKQQLCTEWLLLVVMILEAEGEKEAKWKLQAFLYLNAIPGVLIMWN